MKKLLLSVVLLFSSSVFAGLIGNIEHDYGSSAYTSSCGTTHTDNIKVTNNLGCYGLTDTFDFSVLSFTAIDYFEIELTFSDTNKCDFWECEQWSLMANEFVFNPVQYLNSSKAVVSQIFRFEPNLLFNFFSDNAFSISIISNNWMPQNFKLYSANLNVYGTPASNNIGVPDNADPAKIPAPASIALLGFGLVMLRRFKQ